MTKSLALIVKFDVDWTRNLKGWALHPSNKMPCSVVLALLYNKASYPLYYLAKLWLIGE